MYTSGTTGLPKGIAVRHRNVAMIPNNEPAWTGGGWLHGAPMFTFAGHRVHLQPDEDGAGRLLPAEVRRRAMARLRRDGATDAHACSCRRSPSCSSPTPTSSQPTSRASCRCRSAAHRSRPRRCSRSWSGCPDATVVELLRDDRGRTRVHRDAEGRDHEPHRLGRQADRSDGDQDRRRRRRRGRRRARSASCCCACRASSASTTRTTGATASDLDRRRLAAQRRPRVPRRGRLPLHLRPQEGHDHPRRQQHLRDRRRGGAARAPRRAGGRGRRCPPHRARRGRRRVGRRA